MKEPDYTTLPNEEAARAIASKTAVGRRVFDKLLPELKARAFVVTGLEDLRMVWEVRDAIAELPRGESWKSVAKKVRGLLEQGGFSEEAAAKRAELLVRHHGFQAYAEADYAVKQEMKEVFPYWKYVTMGDHRVREAHAALDGLVLPADDPFWKDHYPPWDWGCRCQVIEITAEEYQEIKDAGRVAGARGFDPTKEEERSQGWVLPEKAEAMLREQGRLEDGTGHPVDVRSPRAKAAKGEDAFGWHPGESSMRASELHRRYIEEDPKTGESREEDWERFYAQMQGARIDDGQGRMRPAWDWVIRDDVRRAAEEARAAAKEKGVEVLAAVDYKTGERFGELVIGKDDRVNVAETMKKAIREETPVAVIHTHPDEAGGPSPADIELALRQPEWLARTGVVQWNGVFHWVRAGKKWEKMDERQKEGLRMQLEEAQDGMPYDEWEKFLKNLEEKGVIEYETTRSL